MTQIEVDFYCRALSLEHPKKDEEDPNGRKNSVQALSSLFMTNLALVGQKSNPSAIIRMAEKIKAKDWTFQKAFDNFRMLDKLTSQLSWLYLQYTFITGIYLLDRAEIIIFNLFSLGSYSGFVILIYVFPQILISNLQQSNQLVDDLLVHCVLTRVLCQTVRSICSWPHSAHSFLVLLLTYLLRFAFHFMYSKIKYLEKWTVK